MTKSIYSSLFSLTKFFIERALKIYEESKKNGEVTSNSEKPVLEKLLEIDTNVAVIMASDMLLGGVDTVSKIIIEFKTFLQQQLIT